MPILFDAHGAQLRRRIGYVAGFERISASSDISLADCIGSTHALEDESEESEMSALRPLRYLRASALKTPSPR